MLVRGGSLVTFSPLGIERADIRLAGGRITEKGPDLKAGPGEAVLDASGCWITPGLVCAHTHFYSSLATGMPPPPDPPSNFVEILERVWWRLDRALDAESLTASAQAGVVGALNSGVTAVIDHHASPSHIDGSLDILAGALGLGGIRGVLAYEVTDRGGHEKARAGLVEHRRFASAGGRDASRCGLLIGAHASFTLSDETLTGCAALAAELGTGLHIHVSEDHADLDDARRRGFRDPVDRLVRAGALGPKTVLAHGVHLDQEAFASVAAADAWVVVNPRSNMNNGVGTAPFALHRGVQTGLGTDGIGADMLDEARALYWKAAETGAGLSPADAVAYLGGAQRLAGSLLGEDLHSLDEGSAADLSIFAYDSPTPATDENVAAHVIFGLSSRRLREVLVAGETVWRGSPVHLDEAAVAARGRRAAADLWSRMRSL